MSKQVSTEIFRSTGQNETGFEMELITLIFLTSFYNFENFYNEMDIFIKGEIIKKQKWEY